MVKLGYKEEIVKELDELPEDEIKEIIDFIEFLKTKKESKKRKDSVRFTTGRLGVKGKITRQEIYSGLS